jgi:predicted RNA-binding protein
MSSITFEKKVVLNRCFGGFSLSMEAALEIAERKGWKLRMDDGYLLVGDSHDQVHERVSRDDPDLIEIVERMGDKASGPSARLVVVKVAMNVDIESFDGREKVHVWAQEL